MRHNGNGASISAQAFCSILYEALGWDEGYTYRSPAVVRRKGNEAILFFDLDNYIGKERSSNKANDNRTASITTERRMESEETRGIFYGADDEPQPVEDTEAIEQRMRQLAEYEKRNYGTPAFEHNSEFRLTAIDDDGEWDVMAEARALGCDHRVDEREIESLQEIMLDAMYTAEDKDE